MRASKDNKSGGSKEDRADAQIEIYTDERIAEFLLTNAVDLSDYEEARREVTAMGLDPDSISQIKPAR